MDVREFWPEITNEEIDTLQTLSHHEWLIVRRLYKDKRIGGREISEDDLIQGFPKEKLGDARKALKSLERKGIIVKKPKPGVKIYQTPPDFFTNPSVTFFIEKIAEMEILRKSLIDPDLDILRVRF